MREKPMEKRENGVRVEHLTGALPMSEMLEEYVDVEKFLGICAACADAASGERRGRFFDGLFTKADAAVAVNMRGN